MDKQYIIDKTNEILIDEFEVEDTAIQPEANLHETLELDSLDYVDLVVLIQNTFDVKLQGDDFKEIETFSHFYDLIQQKKLQTS